MTAEANRTPMDEEKLNISIRRFLKEVGVTSQREIEKAVRDGSAAGDVRGDDRFEATMTLEIPGLSLRHVVHGRIELG